MVGQNLQGRHSEIRAEEEFKTTESSYKDIERILIHLDNQDKQMKKQLDNYPNDARYRILYASALNQFGMSEQAIEQLNIAKTLSPKKQSIYFELSSSYIQKKDYTNALATLKTAYDLEPKNEEATVNLGIAYLYMGDNASAAMTFAKVEKTYDLIKDNRLLGAFVNLGRWNDVINVLRERAKRDPGDVNNYISLASAYLKVGDTADAISALTVVGTLLADYKATADAYIQQIKAGKNPTN